MGDAPEESDRRNRSLINPGEPVPRRFGLIVAMLVVACCMIGLCWSFGLFSKSATTLRISAAPPSRGATIFPDVRVCLGNPTVKSFTLELRGAYQIHPAGDPRIIRSGSALGGTIVTASETGIRIGHDDLPLTRLEIRPLPNAFFWVNDHAYRGLLRVYRRAEGTLLAVNHLPMGEYLASVVDSEMPASFGAEARRAQVIAARTYVLAQMQAAPPGALYDVFASTRSQKYLGYQYLASDGRLLAGESPEGRRYVQETAGVVCTENARLFCTYYSAVCGGETMTGTEIFSDAAACLQSVPCQWCEAASKYRWNTAEDRKEVETRLAAYFRQKGLPFQSLRNLINEPVSRGMLPVFAISDGTNSHRLDGTTLRNVLGPTGLFSQRFATELTTNQLLIHGQGHGHGVGLCQWGARGQALEGRSGIEILMHYYPGARVVRLVP